MISERLASLAATSAAPGSAPPAIEMKPTTTATASAGCAMIRMQEDKFAKPQSFIALISGEKYQPIGITHPRFDL
jgi:hypothetical protein